jgi:hypothetical protein
MMPSLACTLLLVGCAATGETVAPQPDASAHQRLQSLSAKHGELLQRLADAPAPHVESCRSTAGDCLFQVGDSRSRLTSQLRLTACDQSEDFASKSRCVTSQLESAGRSRELAEYLALENWCFSQLTTCTAEKAEAASRAALDSLAAARKQELETGPAALAARSAVAATRARIEYLRATLPPDVPACKPEAEVAACDARVESARKALDESLSRDDYAASTAAETYVSLQRMEDGCRRPELECLSSIVRSYGVFPESRKWVERNLELLGKRQELVARVSPANGARCVTALQQEHQAGIVSAYVAYVHEPVLYFRTQLDKAFMALHQAQVGCLAAKPQTSAAKPAVAAKR